MSKKKTLGILVGGGPAPGINSVISSVVIEAVNNGFEVIGFLEGYKHLAHGHLYPHIKLTIDDVSRITTTGGTFLKTSRLNPAKSEEYLENAVRILRSLQITHLVSIGGEDTAFSTMKVSEYAADQGYPIQAVHVPKTIDNDLPLPEGIPTFGFETARSFGTQIVSILAEDARSTGRWFVVNCMGRKAGHLAMGIGKSAAATLTLIPEEYDNVCTLDKVVDTIVGAIYKRLSKKRNYGIALLAEGFMEIPAPSLLETRDVLNWAGLMKGLKYHDTPQTNRVWEFLGSGCKEVIESWEEGHPVEDEDREIITNCLNEIIRNYHFYDADLFNPKIHKKLDIAKEAKLLMKEKVELEEKGESLTDKQILRLNRLLLESMFLTEIEKSHFLKGMDKVAKDEHGHPILAEVDFSGLLKNEVLERLAEFKNYILDAEDILDWPKFLNNLKNHNSDPKVHVWELLDGECQEIINKWEPHEPFGEKARVKVIDSLNRIINMDDFYNHDVFENTDLLEEADIILKKVLTHISETEKLDLTAYIAKNLPKLKKNQIRRFNRLILKTLFPEEIVKISKMRIVDKDIGYELRCAPPVSFDLEYTRNLGWAAVDFLMNGVSGAMVSIQGNKSVPISFKDMFDPKTGKISVRTVDKESVFYRIAREYMIRLEHEDFIDPAKLKEIAEAAGITPEEFKKEFFHVVEHEIKV